jgi:septal ring factor EnvC (AmiA/AmiB activator)
MDQTIALKPILYTAKKHKEKYIDDVSELSATTFKLTGVVCPCSNKIYRNKYTFQHQHLITVKHINWRSNHSLNDNENNDCEKCIELSQEIKKQKIIIGQIDQKNFILKKTIEDKDIIIEQLKHEINELKENALQYNEHITKEAKTIETLQKRNEKIENGLLSLISEIGYEIENQ